MAGALLRSLGAWRPGRPGWSRGYDRATLTADLVAGLVTAVVLVPQGVAYALLAELPPEAGLYAAVGPILAYALLGSSRVLAVGPVALMSLLTAHTVATSGAAEPWAAAQLLALMVAAILLALAVLRASFLVNFLSEPVIKGFTAGTALVIALSQMPPLLGVSLPRAETALGGLATLVPAVARLSPITAAIGVAALLALLAIGRWGGPALARLGVPSGWAALLAKAGPLAVVAAATAIVAATGLAAPAGGPVAVLGALPAGAPPLGLPAWDLALVQAMLPGALAIALLGYLESIAVARALAVRRGERVAPGRELAALAGANLAAGASGAYPVAGGFGRSMVNHSAGARTPVAMVVTALAVLLALLWLAPALHDLPRAVLAAIILVAVAGLIDLHEPRRLWQLNKTDFAAWALTLGVLLVFGVEAGLAAGAGLSLLTHVARTARPHYAVVGRVPGTQHFRNIRRHRVQTWPHLLVLRIDESLFFANARFLLDTVQAETEGRRELEAVVLSFAGVNGVDATTIETLEQLDAELAARGVALHLTEVKGPVMDLLARSDWTAKLRAAGRVHLDTEGAVAELGGTPARAVETGPEAA